MLRLVLTVIVASLALTAPASAQTSLFTEDAEGEVTAKWTPGPAPKDDRIAQWEKSNGPSRKFRGNQAHGGATSFWAGQPAPFDPQEVVTGESIITTKEPIVIPADGDTTLTFWSIFQNEGDDEGLVQVSTNPTSGFKNVFKIAAVNTSVGVESDESLCDPTHPDVTATAPFTEKKVPLGAYRGQTLYVRFNMKYGSENRSATQPCGWYVDDIAVKTTGTPGNATATPPATGTPPTTMGPPTPSSPPQVRFSKLTAKGKTARLNLQVDFGPLKGVTVQLFDSKGRKRLGSAKIATLADGARVVRFRLKKKLKVTKKSVFVIRVSGKAPDGSAFKTSGKAPGVK